ncbi:MAG: hypothetical protein AB1540_09315 [Bdellovibrionota bacterium]
MRTAFKRISFLFVSVLFSISTVFAGHVDFGSYSNGQLTIVGQGFDKTGARSYQVNIYVNDRFLADINTNSNGSFSYTTPRGSVEPGDRVRVSVLNYNGSGAHKNHNYTVRGGGGHKPDPHPGLPDPPRRGYSEREIREYANQQARTVANRVVKTYGALENWKYNFVDGFWQGFEAYQLESRYSGSAEYRRGIDEGQRQGETSGYQAGQSAAENQAAVAHQEAVARFRAVLDRDGVTPDTARVDVPQIMFSGLQAPAQNAGSVESILDQLNEDLQRELRRLSWSYDAFVLTYDLWEGQWTLRNVYGYGGSGKYAFVDGMFRGERAFSEWKSNRLGGRYDYNIYQKMDYSEQSSFQRYFIDIYEDVIREKYYGSDEPRRRNHDAYARGLFYGERAGRERALYAGRIAGYASSYTPASVSGFNRTFEAAYVRNFHQTVDRFNSSAVIEVQDARLVDENKNGVYEPGERIGLQINRMANLGRQAAHNLPVALESKELLRGAVGTVALEASSTLRSPVLVQGLAQLSADVEADSILSVTARVGSASLALSLKTVSWQQVMETLTQSGSHSGFDSLSQYVLTNLRAEWLDCLQAGKNWYSKGKPDGTRTRLEQLVEHSKRLSANQRQNIRALYPQILRIREEGGGVHPFLRRSYKKLAEQLK